LDGVADLLARDGVPTNPLIAPQVVVPQNSWASERKRGVRRGAKITFASIVMFIPFFAISIAEDHPGPLAVPMTIFLAGVLWMLYYRLFGDDTPLAPGQSQPDQFSQLSRQTSLRHAYLPPPHSAPVYRSVVETPLESSVAEQTTRSLEQR
jgi:hypothetical protein